MIPIPFPTSRITPDEDPSERAMREIGSALDTIKHCMTTAITDGRARQLHERAMLCEAMCANLVSWSLARPYPSTRVPR